ncbi:MAG: hypothetical protein IJU47_08295 [Verrucomicrobia bacterium]|nr:hypothetical protein [Verrucomicrobiota bacterium]
MKILNKKMFHASLCLFLVTVGVYGGKICDRYQGGHKCSVREESGEGADAFCSRHTVPDYQCVNGNKQCRVNTNLNEKVIVTVEHGKCLNEFGGLVCMELEIQKELAYEYIRGCETIE